jgi:hypothetical protein
MNAKTRRVKGGGGYIRSRPTLRLYRYYSTRAKNLYRQGKTKEAQKYWGKAGAVKRRMKATAEKVRRKLPEIEKVKAEAKRVKRRVKEERPRLKKFTFSARVSYRGKAEKSHDYFLELEGVAVCEKPGDIEAMVKEAILKAEEEGDEELGYYFFTIPGRWVIGITREEPTNETRPRLAELRVVVFRRL